MIRLEHSAQTSSESVHVYVLHLSATLLKINLAQYDTKKTSGLNEHV